MTDRSTVNEPNPPDVKAMISPPGFVWLIAAAKLRQGEATVHGLVSTPAMETALRAFCANKAGVTETTTAATKGTMRLFMGPPLFRGSDHTPKI